MSAIAFCASSLISKQMGALLLLVWILFWTFNLLIVPYSSIIFIFMMSLSVISLLSLYVTNRFLCFVHVFIKCSLESYAWDFFLYLHQFCCFFLSLLVTETYFLSYGALFIGPLLFYGLKVFYFIAFVPCVHFHH